MNFSIQKPLKCQKIPNNEWRYGPNISTKTRNSVGQIHPSGPKAVKILDINKIFLSGGKVLLGQCSINNK